MPRGKQFLYDGGIRVPLIVRWPGVVKAGAVENRLVSAIDLAATSLAAAGMELPRAMEGRPFVGPGAAAQSPREHVIAARDRCDETLDRIRCVRTARYKYIRNLMPDRPYTQPNRYKETSYPTLAVMRKWKAEGRLNEAQAGFMADRRPEEELYDLEADPHELKNLAGAASHDGTLRQLRGTLEEWIKSTGDLGQHPEKPENVRGRA
jgi:arylsulfatase A-like enzyme